MLSLPEELLLLALHDEKGKIVFAASASLLFGLAGAALLELTLQNRVAIEDKKLVVRSDKLTGDDILDERTAMIISLVAACDLINEIFPKGERKAARKRAKEIAKSELVGKAVADATQAVQAAIVASVAAATAAAV